MLSRYSLEKCVKLNYCKNSGIVTRLSRLQNNAEGNLTMQVAGIYNIQHVPKRIPRILMHMTFEGKQMWRCWCLTLILLTCRIWWATNNASKWQMGFNLWRLTTHKWVVPQRHPPYVAFYIFTQQIWARNILNMLHILRFFSLQNAVYFTMLPFFVPVLFTF